MEAIFIVAILLMSVVIHEVSHGYAALWLGDPTAKLQGRLTLNPIKHIDPFGSVILPLLFIILPTNFVMGWAKPVPYNPYNFKKHHKWGDAIVAGVGPAVNILIAIIFSVLIRLSDVLSLSPSFVEVSAIVVIVNVVLALFNLIPLPPLDGSKILFTILPPKLAKLRIFIEKYSFVVILLFIFLLFDWFALVVLGAASVLTDLPIIYFASIL